jgi:hypothetical protein
MHETVAVAIYKKAMIGSDEANVALQRTAKG